MLDLVKLSRFLKVVELGSLTKAAVMLDTTQSALSLQIGALERQFGRRLFHATGRGVALAAEVLRDLGLGAGEIERLRETGIV